MNIVIQNLLLADLFEAIVPLLLVAFWVLRQVLEAKRGGDLALPDEAEPARGDAPQAAGQQDPVRSEVDEFLKKLGKGQPEEELQGDAGAEQRRLEQQQQREQPVSIGEQRREEQKKAKREQDRKIREERRRQAATQARANQNRPSARRVEILVEEDSLNQQRRSQNPTESLSDRHLSHLKESQLAEQAAHLGEGIAQSDERLEARLHSKFDDRPNRHRPNLLMGAAEKPETSTSPSPTTAESIAAMLKTPEGMRNAVVLNEILRRPYQ